jgi:hypothetical protein
MASSAGSSPPPSERPWATEGIGHRNQVFWVNVEMIPYVANPACGDILTATDSVVY